MVSKVESNDSAAVALGKVYSFLLEVAASKRLENRLAEAPTHSSQELETNKPRQDSEDDDKTKP